MSFDQLRSEFLEPETRDGYYVSAEMKAIWKVLLDLLEEIARICDKYGLEWTLEGGSLLGAMRHRGFIPWDDDIDVVMPRKDYDRLVAVMPRELPEYYELQSTAWTPGFHIPHLMLRDSRTTGIDPAHVAAHKRFNMGIRIDILALDGMPAAAWKRGLVLRYVDLVKYAVPSAPLGKGEPFRERWRHWVGGCLALFGQRFAYWLREWPLRHFSMDRCEWCGSLVGRNFWHPHSIRKCEWFREYVRVPFEYLMVPVPKDYDKILTQQFKDWRKPVRGGAYHGELLFNPRVDWKTVLVEKYGYTREELASADGAKCKVSR